jgi:signal transduction histidine kinase
MDARDATDVPNPDPHDGGGDGMKKRNLVRASRLVFALVMSAYVAALALAVLNWAAHGPAVAQRDSASIGSLLFYSAMLSFPVVGLIISSRQPQNRIAWIFLAIGLAWELWWFGTSYLEYGVVTNPGSVPAPGVVAALTDWMWAPAIGLTGTLLILLFPDGRLPSPRWRPFAWLSVIAIGLSAVADMLLPGSFTNIGFPNVRNPLGIEALVPVLNVIQFAVALIPLCIVGSAVSIIKRFRQSRGVERLQIKWLAAAGATVAVGYIVFWIAGIPYVSDPTPPAWATVIKEMGVFTVCLIPLAAGVAILKYRLYDIEIVINKALVYGAMAAFITAVYVAIVVGIGRSLGSERNLGLSILATGLVAVAFQPVRGRVQRFANRLVYGERATPYEVLSAFSGGMARTVATEDLLPRMARIVAEGTGAARADVWLRVGSELVREASWPEEDVGAKVAEPVSDDGVTTLRDTDRAVPVRHRGELLGVIGVKKSAGEAVTPADEKLLQDLASQAGLVLRNVRLIEELRSSRQRLVSAQDEERRRLERDLHDGAQQRLVAISVVLRMARSLVDAETEGAVGERIDQVSEELTRALNELREFARGIHPTILTESGLGPALESLAERSTVPATVDASLDGRLPRAVEATAYFVASEALANVAKYAKANRVTIRAAMDDGELTVEVADDGIGGADPSRGSGLRGLSDRVAAVDGTMAIQSPPGEGTQLTVRIPVPAFVEATA